MSQFQLTAIEIGLIFVILLLLGLFPPQWLFAIIANVFPRAIYVSTTSTKVIALTIDNGPHPTTTELILDTLARHQVTATLFDAHWDRNTAITLDRVLPQLQQRGYQIVTLSQLVDRQ